MCGRPCACKTSTSSAGKGYAASRAGSLSQRYPSRAGTAWKAVCRRGLGMRQPAVIPWLGWGVRGAAGGVAWCKEGCLFLRKGAEGGGGTLFPPVHPPLSPRHPPQDAVRRQAGVSALGSHILPPPPTRACRGRSRHAPAALERRKQIGLPAGVQGAGRPWLASHHRSVGPGCGEHRGRGTGWRGPTWWWGPHRRQGPCGKLGVTLV